MADIILSQVYATGERVSFERKICFLLPVFYHLECLPLSSEVIVIEAILDRDIVLTVKGHSKMVMGYKSGENHSIRKSVEIYQLCFGLDFAEV